MVSKAAGELEEETGSAASTPGIPQQRKHNTNRARLRPSFMKSGERRSVIRTRSMSPPATPGWKQVSSSADNYRAFRTQASMGMAGSSLMNFGRS